MQFFYYYRSDSPNGIVGFNKNNENIINDFIKFFWRTTSGDSSHNVSDECQI